VPIHKKEITLAAFTTGLIASQYLRNFASVIAPQLTTDLTLTPTSFGWLTASFFIAFALAQIPLGLAFARIGVRRPTAIAMLVGVVSLIAFASAPNAWFALFAMAGIGIACAPVLCELVAVTH
jgi:MFS family permease